LEAELSITRQGEGEKTEEKLQSIIKARDDYVAQVTKANERLRETNDALREEVEELTGDGRDSEGARKIWRGRRGCTLAITCCNIVQV
jgi:cell division protein FtsB